MYNEEIAVANLINRTMDKNLQVDKSIEIHASAQKVWDALTNPDKIKIYLFGTETITDWKVGSSIIFEGNYQGHQYKDKGNVLQNNLNETLQYDYWSGFSGLADVPENYALVTYHIEKIADNKVKFTWTQQGFANEEGKCHTENALGAMLQQIKELVEQE